MPSRRQLRVGELLQRELAKMIAYELRDPRLECASITRVEITADLRLAHVYVSCLGDEAEGKQALEALRHASGLLRREIGQRTELRYVPDLTFHFDQGLLASLRINQLLDEIGSAENATPEEDDS